MRNLQPVIAFLYDCDLTLIPEYMQNPMLRSFGLNPEDFWRETWTWIDQQAALGVNLDPENSYLNLFLKYVHEGRFPPLSNSQLREFGKTIVPFPGLPDFFKKLKLHIEHNPRYVEHGLKLENYIISTGLKEMIVGSLLDDPEYVTGVYASEFLEENGTIKGIARAVGHMKKTEFIHLINKGGNLNKDIDVNGKIAYEQRRVPFENMVYVGDGPTDVPCFATINKRGGKCVAVYSSESEKAFKQACQLQSEGRVFTIGPADFQPGSHIYRVMFHLAEQIADRIVNDRRDELRNKIGPALRF